MNAVVDAALGPLSPTALIVERERLLQLRTALPALWLVPETLQLHEALSQPFDFTLDVLATSAHVDIRALVGEQVSVRLRLADGRYRAWHGYVFDAAQAGSNGGLARYRLEGRSWLSFLAARINTHLHQRQTALDIAESIFAEYPQANWRVEVSPDTRAAMRVREQCLQFNESDLALVSRLLAEEGLLFHFEHLDDDAADQAEPGHARHVLVITDAGSSRADLGTLRYTQPRPDGRQPGPTDTITHLALHAHGPLASASIGQWDPLALRGHAGATGGPLPEHYDGSAAAHTDAAQAQRAADQQLAASELASRRWLGTGHARRLAAGAHLAVTEHPLGDQALVLLAVEHRAANHLGEIAEQGLAAVAAVAQGPGEYLVQFEAAPAEPMLVPAVPPRPRAPLALTARVVGHEQRRLTTDRDLRVKVQFDFQRGARPNRAGLAYGSALGEESAAFAGNAPGNQDSGAWLRVLVPVAGADWGWVLPPRIGAEVLVYFVDGDLDQPVVGGSLYGGEAPPPFAAGVDSGVNHPGTISGQHAQALDGSGANQWIHDDATGQLRLRLHTTQWGSELGLGHLIQHGTQSAQRGAWRGAGFEALTQGWAVARAGQGLLATTQARCGTYGSAQGSQMDAAEALARLNAARALGQRLGAAAAALGAQGLRSHDDGQASQHLARAIDPQQDGHHPAQVNGQAATIPADERAGAGRPVPAFAEPLVVLDSASALLAASGASTQLYAGQGLSLVAQGDLHHAVAHTYAQVSGQGASLFTHAGGITAHAGNGPVSVRAHTDALQLLASQGISVSSVNDEIRIFAKDKLTLGAADSSLELDGIDITVTTPGVYEQHGGHHAMLPGGSAPAELAYLPDQRPAEPTNWIAINHNDADGAAMAGQRYKIFFEGGSVISGQLDDQGRARHDNVPKVARHVEYEPREPQAGPRWTAWQQMTLAAKQKLG